MATPSQPLEGFSETAHYISSSSQLALLRRFDTLAARNLLYLQAQLHAIEIQLKALDLKDATSIAKHSDDFWQLLCASRDWAAFERESQQNGGLEEKMQLVLKLRVVMKEYQEALVLHTKVLKLPEPEGYISSIFKDWLKKRQPFLGDAQESLVVCKDIASLGPVIDRDLLSRALQASLGYLFRQRQRNAESLDDEIYYYSEKGLAKLVKIVSVLLATGLLFGAICALSFVNPTAIRTKIATIGAFTAAFAVTVGLLTDAKRTELFTAVAGYSAVLVVFTTFNAAAPT